MRLYLYSLGVGVLVGVIYGALNVKSPAPPVVALLGLFGMLGGEQVGKRVSDWRSLVQATQVSSILSETGCPARAPAGQLKDKSSGHAPP
jgi:XapX domain-containing protein